MIKLKLNDDIVSTQDFQEVIEELRQYLKWYNHNMVKIKVAKKKDPNEPELSPGSTDLLKQYFSSQPLSSSGLDKLIVSLVEYLDQADKVRITLADMPTVNLKKQLVNWCRQSLSETVLVDFGYNRTLLGGMVIKCGSHIYDWSYRHQILENQDKLVKVF